MQRAFAPFVILAAALPAPAAVQAASGSCANSNTGDAPMAAAGTTVIRSGSGHQAIVSRTDPDGTLHLEQRGRDHQAIAVQSGEGGRLVVEQQGASASAEVAQGGACNDTVLTQAGQGNQATVSQSGSGNRVVVRQFARGE